MVEHNIIYLPTDPPVARFVRLNVTSVSNLESQSQAFEIVIPSSPTDDSDPGEVVIQATLERTVSPNRLHLPLNVPNGDAQSLSAVGEAVWVALTWYFQRAGYQQPLTPKGNPCPESCVELVFKSDSPAACAQFATHLEELGLVEFEIQLEENNVFRPLVFASTFWQIQPEIFLPKLGAHRYLPPKPLRYTLSNGVIRHPKRPLPPTVKSPFYTRHCVSEKINSVFKLRPVDMSDLDLIHKWMNNLRVAEFWGEQGPIEHQKKFLEKCLSSQHSFAAIGSWNDLDEEENLTLWRDACFFDIYWVKEDHLARYVNDIKDWDRGVHLLVGEDWARGRSTAWLDSIVHYVFLADPRTQSLYLEPRVDNDFVRPTD
ncbi:hypothetical protein TWF694_008633 [Orbilia ellipsospora]|uniref:Acyltransferase MbtK/IucB-like conserved domain-containing protein n=1 Tax=Orbilia ellipsospora TaxID=2528407 RepID=A0AAV9XI52_9PEZI